MEAQQENTTRVIVEKQEGNGLGVTGLVLGIIGVALNFIPFLPYLLGALAVIFGYIGMQKPVKKGIAKAGFILGLVSIGMKFLFWISLFFIGSTA